MPRTFRTAAMLTAIAALASGGCNSAGRHYRPSGDVRLPSAPVLEPSPSTVDPEKVGTAGSPAPPPAGNGISPSPTLSPFGE